MSKRWPKPIAMGKDMRLWTAIAMIGICGLSIAQGFKIVQFSFDMMNINSSEEPAKVVGPWTATQGLASAALQAELKEKVDTYDRNASNRGREAHSAILSIKPLSSMDWLSLSRALLAIDQPMEQVLQSFMLSMLTGPNEGFIMAERGVFGVSLWDSLSPDFKRRVAIDLSAGEITVLEQLRASLSAEPERVRSELRAAMLTTGISPKEVQRRLGY